MKPMDRNGSPTRDCKHRFVTDSRIFANGNSYYGTWLDGRMEGKGQYTWYDGSEYEGEFHDGYIWGTGTWTCPHSSMKYTGEFRREMIWGEGVMTWESGEKYTGQYRRGGFHGEGTHVFANGDIYTGSHSENKQHGLGTLKTGDGWTYTGKWVKGMMQGKGRVEWASGVVYDGEWVDGIREGSGKITSPDNYSYEGQFEANEIRGMGHMSFPDGSWSKGLFHDGYLDGRGIFHAVCDSCQWIEYDGIWRDDVFSGPGIQRFHNGITIMCAKFSGSTSALNTFGACSDGVKTWPHPKNGPATFTGSLMHNRIVDGLGTLQCAQWHYRGQFVDECLHGSGELIWWGDNGIANATESRPNRYNGNFVRNHFQRDGTLVFAHDATYTGQFANGVYHGTGSFIWPCRTRKYVGQWMNGVMSGEGTLTDDGARMIYRGAFANGHAEGAGVVLFDLTHDMYSGEFHGGVFHGLGVYYSARDGGAECCGRWENGVLSGLGRKRYSDGRVYVGQFLGDLEHGRGVLTDMRKETRMVAIWEHGVAREVYSEIVRPVPVLDPTDTAEELVFCGTLFEDVEPAVDGKVEPAEDGRVESAVDGKVESAVDGKVESAVDGKVESAVDEKVESAVGGKVESAVDGKVVLVYGNGDKYIGNVKNGRKHGRGIYIYADDSCYKGVWEDDMLNGTKFPACESSHSVEIEKFRQLNVDLRENVVALAACRSKSTKLI